MEIIMKIMITIHDVMMDMKGICVEVVETIIMVRKFLNLTYNCKILVLSQTILIQIVVIVMIDTIILGIVEDINHQIEVVVALEVVEVVVNPVKEELVKACHSYHLKVNNFDSIMHF